MFFLCFSLGEIIVESNVLYHKANDPHEVVVDDDLEVIQDAVPDIDHNVQQFIEKVQALTAFSLGSRTLFSHATQDISLRSPQDFRKRVMVLSHFQNLSFIHLLGVFHDVFGETSCHYIVDSSNKHKSSECLGDLTSNRLLSDDNDHGCDKHERGN